MTFVTTGLEHLGIEALSAYLRAHGHETALVYEPRPFSSGSGTDSALLARLLEPPPEETAARVVRTKPDVVAFSSYSVTHRWAVEVARAIKATRKVPIVFGGQHVGSTPERAILEPAIDAVVEGEGEGALLDLVNCAETGRFGRRDIPNVTTKGLLTPRRNMPRPLVQDLDELPFADKSMFYEAVPGYEQEYYIISRRGCPYRCSFCEYSHFPAQYPGEKPVRRRSVEHVLRELRPFKARGRTRKVFFWDPIFTLDNRWMAEFAEAYSTEIGIPFECYTHPNAMNREMASHLARAGCIMVRVGVQTVNADTLAAVDRRGDEDRIRKTLGYLVDFGIPYSVDHIIGLPGEGPSDQVAALRFYNDVRPTRILAHWMTYFPGTTALDQAREQGILTEEAVGRILDGEVGPGYMYEGNIAHAEQDELRRLSNLFDILPLLPQPALEWLLDTQNYRKLPKSSILRQIGVVGLVLKGDRATRDRVRHLASTLLEALAGGAYDRARAAIAPAG
ncbi:Radical SAM domain protein [Minicystis rosea]|nr:Radical SAM domain protein [Minicystis rosea]